MRTACGIVGVVGLAMALASCAARPEVESAQRTQSRWPTQAAPVWAMGGDVDGGSRGGSQTALMAARFAAPEWGRIEARADLDMVAGTLVTMTGQNVRDGDEMRVGVEPVTRVNDPAAIGVVMAQGVSAFDRSLEGARASRGVGREGDIVIGAFAHEVATAGLVRMWVVEERRDDARGQRDLSPGDLLISGDAPGCAMLDDASRFGVGYVVARVAEHVAWGNANPADTGADGRRRMLVAVMLERFVRPALGGLSRADVTELQQRELDRWQQEWELDASRRYRWEDMSRTWDEMDRFKKNWGNDWNDEKTWRDLRDSTKRMHEQDEQLKRLRDDLDKSRRELDDTRKGLDDLSRDVKGGRNDTGGRGGSDGGVRPSPR